MAPTLCGVSKKYTKFLVKFVVQGLDAETKGGHRVDCEVIFDTVK
jgi:hypothetical protein